MDKEIQAKIKILEKEYILRAEHERIVADLERQLRQAQKNPKNQEDKVSTESTEAIRKAHEQALKQQEEKHQAEIALLKGRLR